MENKYYTPEIEDINIGDHIEIYEQQNNKLIKDVKWHSLEVTVNENEWGSKVSMNRLPRLLKQDNVRIKFLDREDIESCGFIYDEHEPSCLAFVKGVWDIWYYNDKKVLEVESEETGLIFRGVVKNKSKFEEILKMIGYGK